MKTKHTAVFNFATKEPPNSAPTHFLRKWSKASARQQTMQNVKTLKPKFLVSTTKAAPEISDATSGYSASHSASLPWNFQYRAAMVQGAPRPKNTFTELLPVMLTTEASAVGSSWAAESDAKRSGIEVPRATKVTAVTMSGMEMTQPKSSARSEMQAVTPAMPKSEQVKESQPPKKVVGGKMLKSTFQGTEMTCMIRSDVEAGSSPSPPLTRKLPLICWRQSSMPFWNVYTLMTRSILLSMLRVVPPGRTSTVMVRKVWPSPPSSAGSRWRSPSGSSRMTKSLLSALHGVLAMISISMLLCVSPGENSTRPSTFSKS
mmetsp:Transcript_42683/g.120560  ORF Transcript_42683/g.120560 Transcript_42683/m.120560 type:complete len:317 (+) Transcript_42683:386-1336(+)